MKESDLQAHFDDYEVRRGQRPVRAYLHPKDYDEILASLSPTREALEPVRCQDGKARVVAVEYCGVQLHSDAEVTPGTATLRRLAKGARPVKGVVHQHREIEDIGYHAEGERPQDCWLCAEVTP